MWDCVDVYDFLLFMIWFNIFDMKGECNVFLWFEWKLIYFENLGFCVCVVKVGEKRKEEDMVDLVGLFGRSDVVNLEFVFLE